MRGCKEPSGVWSSSSLSYDFHDMHCFGVFGLDGTLDLMARASGNGLVDGSILVNILDNVHITTATFSFLSSFLHCQALFDQIYMHNSYSSPEAL